MIQGTLLTATIATGFAPAPARAELEEIIVTAQKRTESIQDVPIAITAFDESALKARQIATFGDVRFAAPNVGFAKSNFTGNNFQIRGIGTVLVAAGSDDGVGIHVNEVPILFPRLFETEYYDVEQVVILRGPQGTLYGRNSTGGAVNMITRTAITRETEGYLEAQYGDYDHMKIEGAINVPLGEQFAFRLAGIRLQRDGYTENVYTGEDIDDRDQYSVRGSLRWEPGGDTSVNLMISYFDEDSSRARSQKQLCKNDPSAILGCLPDELAFETVNPLAQLTGLLPSRLGIFGPQPVLGNNPSPNPRDMREVYMDFEPVYQADETLVTLRLEHEFESYSLAAIAGYQDTSVLSQQDYNNNVSATATASALLPAFAPITHATYFADGCLPISAPSKSGTGIIGGHSGGCSNTLNGYDQSNQDTEQYTLEAHLASNHQGALNFLVGAFYMSADTSNEYYVIASGLDYFSVVFPAVPTALGGLWGIDGYGYVAPSYINRVNSYELESSAAFGEIYYRIRDDLKLTLGARYSVDEKNIDDVQYLFNTFVPFGFDGAITSQGGAPLNRIDREKWEETTGRVVLDWSPDIEHTDATLFYASYSRGYKGGGFNPPFDAALFPGTAATYDPEFVDAFEIGTKNRLFDNTLQANLTAFHYDYQGLQVSKIINRTSFNENADAEIYGAEAELLFAPDAHWQLNANFAYLHTAVQDFASVDTRDPTDGRSDVTLIKDNLNASNCVIHHNGAAAPALASQVASCSGLKATLPAPYTVNEGVAVDLDGNQLVNSPELTVSLGAQYTFVLPGDYSLVTRLDYYWQDEMYGRIFNRDPIDQIDSWDIWNAQATVRSPDASWFVRAFIKNIEDDDNVVGMYVSDPSSGLFTNVFTIEPRTYGLAVGYNF